MMTITMRPERGSLLLRNYFFVLCFVLCYSAYPKDSFSGTLEFDTGLTHGTSDEYVVQYSKTISRLDWQEQWIPLISIAGQVNFFNCFAGGAVRYAIPLKSGSMQDYDFLLANATAVSLYSQHDAYLDKDFSVSAHLGCTFELQNWHCIPSAGFLYRSRKWTAVDGYTQYPSDGGMWTGNEPKRTVTGTGISYEQSIQFFFAAITIRYTLNKNFEIDLNGSFYPYIWAQSLDSHFLKEKQFYDNGMKNGIGGKIGLSALQYPTATANRFAVTVNVEYEIIGRLKGDTASSPIGVTDAEMTKSDGYGSKMENNEWHIEAGVVLCEFIDVVQKSGVSLEHIPNLH